MAGMIELSEEVSWSVVGWIYRKAVKDLAEELQATNPGVAVTLSEACEQFCVDLTEITREELAAVREAVSRLLDRYEPEGPGAFYMPEAHPAFVGEVRDLYSKVEQVAAQRASGAEGASDG